MKMNDADQTSALLATLRDIVGRRHVLTDAAHTRRYRRGYRFGDSSVLAVIRPGSLVEQWRVAVACVAADVTIIMQAANTGLTGGSTPDGLDYPTDVIMISTLRIGRFHVINGGTQVICLPGTTLYALESALALLGREPHSVIGSSCLGASVIGGICNSSGGALVRRGPAFTELALFARVTREGKLELVNHLGIRLGEEPEDVLRRIERGAFTPDDIDQDSLRRASCSTYGVHVRDLDAATPARFNADPRNLFEASGSAGKLIIFAVRMDTFAQDTDAATFYVGTNEPAELAALRRSLLRTLDSLPISGEYLHRDAFDIASRYGKDVFLAIQYLGTRRLPRLLALRTAVDAMAARLGLARFNTSDRLLQAISRLFPRHLPRRLYAFRDRFEHHLILRVSRGDAASTRASLESLFRSSSGDFFECTEEEAAKAFLHRFATAGAAVRYRALHPRQVEDILALDIALPRNTQEWFETLPATIERRVLHKLYYGHFFCHVFHQDYVVAKGNDPIALEHEMWALLDGRGAEYPAEHNIGHIYKAKPALAHFYQSIDPRNQLNPGIGQTTKHRNWEEPTSQASISSID